MAARAVVDKVEIDGAGNISVRLKKQIVDGGVSYDIGYQRVTIDAGGDCEARLAAANIDLARGGFPPIDASKVSEIKNYSTIAFTPERVSAAEATRAAPLTPRGG